VLDPIDGTSFFADGSPEWRIQMALEEDGELLVALVDMPALDVRWWATRGGGTFERAADGSVRRLAVSTTSSSPTPSSPATRTRSPGGCRSGPAAELEAVVAARGHPGGDRGVLRRLLPGVGPRTLGPAGGGGGRTLHRPRGRALTAKRGGLYSNAAVHDALLSAIDAPRRRGA
jgi:hypothetical protein